MTNRQRKTDGRTDILIANAALNYVAQPTKNAKRFMQIGTNMAYRETANYTNITFKQVRIAVV